MKNRSPQLFLFTGAVMLAVLCVISTGLIVSPLEQFGNFIRNPLRFSTRTTLSGPVVLQQVQKLSRLETTRYNGQAVVRGDTSGILPSWFAGDKILFVAQGEVVAGVDLSKMQEGDVEVKGNRVTLRVPPAEVFHTRLDNQQSEVFQRNVGLFSRPDNDLETKVRQEAEDRIREAALESGVLQTAQRNAHNTLSELLKSLGFDEVQFAD